MKKIAFFCIPAHGHTNPMLPVAAKLVERGNTVKFYSFDEFAEKIKKTGAEYVSCDPFLTELTKQEEQGLKEISSTEMTIQDIRITLRMDSFLDEEFKSFQPDVVYTDSVCFWGKLNAWKHNVPMVVSTSTFAYNQLSSQYMKNSPKEIKDLILGMPRVSKELKKLEPYGYHVKNVLSLIQSDNDTDSIVYTSQRFQPYGESFSDHYAFVGPSVFSTVIPDKKKERPLVYISMGTIINDRPDLYSSCIEALKDQNVDVIISCGKTLDPKTLGVLPDNIEVKPYVDQLDVLSRADVFITHCGMNSVSESLYMATPMVLYPQTNEQKAVARRVMEVNAGTLLNDDSAEGIRSAVRQILDDGSYAKAAQACCDDFRSCSGTEGAAEFIETAPHTSESIDVVKELNKANTRFMIFYWIAVILMIILTALFITRRNAWIIGAAAGYLYPNFANTFREQAYEKLTAYKKQRD
ncbi:MAG: glycosyl transferase [Oscillospiraceae bacterium]|nr:glycosyl transferase [Oscillospiraceae bacterium]MBQ6493369.1 glucosyltransferase [Erysipelotrichaceae bacterium]